MIVTRPRTTLMLAISLTILGDAVTCHVVNALPRGKSAPSSSRSDVTPQATRLRASSPVVIYSRKRGHQTIEHLNVTVSNVGLAVATYVDVTAEFPDGITYPLKGPRKIAPGQRCLYSLSGKKTVVRVGNPKIVMSCGSCAR